MTDLTAICKAVVTLIFAIITTYGIPFIKNVVIPYINEKIEAEKLNTICKWVKMAVEAAEQQYKESGTGAKKNKYVKDFLEKKGIYIDLEQVDVLIESEVLNLKKEAPDGNSK